MSRYLHKPLRVKISDVVSPHDDRVEEDRDDAQNFGPKRQSSSRARRAKSMADGGVPRAVLWDTYLSLLTYLIGRIVGEAWARPGMDPARQLAE
ncbi:MAG: hypothetical protein ACYCZV_16860 [Acidimicrobiales bacterium]